MDEVKRFARVFDGLRRAHGTSIIKKRTDEAGKRKSTGETVQQELTHEVFRKHLTGERSLGVVPINEDDECYWGAIDVDQYDNLDHKAIIDRVVKNKLPLIVCRSKSGGAHIYAFFTQALPARDVKQQLQRVATLLGQPGVEVFPKQSNLASKNDVGNWINLPYFAGDETERYAMGEDGKRLSLVEFIDRAEAYAMSSISGLSIEMPKTMSDGPPCLQHLAMEGVPRGSRNNALFNFGVYAQRKYGDEWADQLDEYNRKYFDPPLASAEVQNVIKSLSRKETYGFTCEQPPIAPICSRGICLTRRHGIQPGSDNSASVQIDGIRKLMTVPPIYFVDIEGKTIQLSSKELYDQRLFSLRTMEAMDRVPTRMKEATWNVILNSLLSGMEDEAKIEVPYEVTPDGQLMTYLEDWLSESAVGHERQDLLLGRPYHGLENGDGDRTYFRSMDLFDYLRRQRFAELSQSEVWATLRGEGAGKVQFNVKGRNVKAWFIKNERLRISSREPLDAKHVDDGESI